MPDIDLHTAYKSEVYILEHLFGHPGEGFFVPDYQREYTWEEENINQLFEDFLLGISELPDEKNENVITFLGSVIFIKQTDNRDTVEKGEANAEPTAVLRIVDGQQRISTIALLAINIQERLKSLSSKLPDEEPYIILRNRCKQLKKSLSNLYSTDIERGASPPRKPRIICAKEDRWTYKGDDSSYKSPVAHYIATYIRTGDMQKAFNAVKSVSNGGRVRRNVESICKWLNAIRDAHIPPPPEPPELSLHDQFPTGEKIVSERMQRYILDYKCDNDDLINIIKKSETDKTSHEYLAVSAYHTFFLAYYLLKRCVVNRLWSTHRELGFDMFQALNATGTPLTAMETFRPQVMQAEMKETNHWEETPSSEYMNEIEELFKATSNNQQKSSRTNELLTAFALYYNGEKLGNKFSAQRRWITKTYEKNLRTINEKREFLFRFAQVAKFYHATWYMDDPSYVKELEEHKEGSLASFLIEYMKNANSKLSAPILARFYNQAIEGKTSMDEFVEAVKACAAFFTLWRSSQSTTSGLPEIYRKFFKGSDKPVKIRKHSWKDNSKTLSSKNLKQYFRDVLKGYGINSDDEESWMTKSERCLLYTEMKVICRFVLFLAGHDRIEDEKHPGLTRPGTKNVCSLLNLEKWNSKNYKTLEHIAPQSPPEGHGWDSKIYEKNYKKHEIGNLLLLQTEINNHADNKNWEQKYIYYSHVGNRGKASIEEMRKEAERTGMKFRDETIKKLSSKTSYNGVVKPILTLGRKGSWNAEIIDQRTRQIKKIAYEKLTSWLN